MRTDTFWEESVYRKGLQMNRWPFSSVVSAVHREFAQRPGPPGAALELGCGVGNNLWFLAEAGFTVAGIEQSPTAITAAARMLESKGAQADLRVGSCAQLPWADRSFDLVLDRGAISCNPHAEVARIVAEAARVLRPGGVFLAFTLFGSAHPDRDYGRAVEHGLYTDFRAGLFTKGGAIAFFDVDDLHRLFGAHFTIDITRQVSFDGGGRLLAEEFDLRAVHRGCT